MMMTNSNYLLMVLIYHWLPIETAACFRQYSNSDQPRLCGKAHSQHLPARRLTGRSCPSLSLVAASSCPTSASHTQSESQLLESQLCHTSDWAQASWKQDNRQERHKYAPSDPLLHHRRSYSFYRVTHVRASVPHDATAPVYPSSDFLVFASLAHLHI